MLRAVIVLRAIAKLSQSLNRPPILDQLDLELRAGETCGLCGPGAGGKSLLLKILCGLVRPDAGSVSVDGVDLQTASPSELMRVQSSIGMLFQNNALFDSLSVLENVAFPLVQRVQRSREEATHEEVMTRAQEALRGVGLAQQSALQPAVCQHRPPGGAR